MKVLTRMQTRRAISSALLLVPLAAMSLRMRAADSARIEVWTGPSCSCCHDWIKHLEANGFDVTTHDGGNSDARSRLKMPINFGSCHTGDAGGYAIEGHVPAREIKRVLEERPDAIGLAVLRCHAGRQAWTGPSTVAFVTHMMCF